MSSQIKPIKLWGHGGPNPPKVAIVLEELGIPYEQVPISLAEVKGPEYTAINPNGRIPAIYDPNTDLTLWESGAIVEYLTKRYDTDLKFSFPSGSNEEALARQWLFFQVSGQGPYYGQLAWFTKYHPEKIHSARERYFNEVNRVTGVLEGHLAKQKPAESEDGPWLVGNRISYADIAFVNWQTAIANFVAKDEYDIDNFPQVKRWIQNMTARRSVKIVMESNQRAQQKIQDEHARQQAQSEQ